MRLIVVMWIALGLFVLFLHAATGNMVDTITASAFFVVVALKITVMALPRIWRDRQPQPRPGPSPQPANLNRRP